jgi:small-conductance mechanosensitive channel
VFAGIGLLALLALAYGILSNFMEFVLTQALIDREIHVRRYFSAHVGNGLRLFLFRLVLGVIWLGIALVIGLAVFFLALGGEAANIGTSSLLALSGLFIAVFAVLAISYGIVFGFTTVFVVPLMTADDDGVLAGWSRLWGSMKSAPKQYLAYLFFSIILQIGVGIVGAIFGIIAFLAVLIPFGLVALALYFALQNTVGVVLAGIVGLLGLLVLFIIGALIQVPLTTFLRYYAMLVLGDIDADLDPIPEVRSAIRAE